MVVSTWPVLIVGRRYFEGSQYLVVAAEPVDTRDCGPGEEGDNMVAALGYDHLDDNPAGRKRQKHGVDNEQQEGAKDKTNSSDLFMSCL